MVELSMGEDVKVIRPSLAAKSMAEKEKSETPPLAHSQALTRPQNTPSMSVNQPSKPLLSSIPG